MIDSSQTGGTLVAYINDNLMFTTANTTYLSFDSFTMYDISTGDSWSLERASGGITGAPSSSDQAILRRGTHRRTPVPGGHSREFHNQVYFDAQCRSMSTFIRHSASTHGRCCMIHGHCVGWVDRQVTCKSKRRLCNIIGCACVSATSDLVHYSSCDETRVDVPTYITCMQRHHEHDSDSAIECTDRRS